MTEPEPPAEQTPIAERTALLAAQELRLVSALVLILGAGLFLALPYVLSSGSVVFLPLVAAMILTLTLSPLAVRIASLGIPNLIAATMAILTLIAVVALALLLILQPAVDMMDQIPAMARKVANEFVQIRNNLSWTNDINRALTRLTGRIPSREVVVAAPTVIERVAVATPSVVLEVLLTLLMTFFMVLSRLSLRSRFLQDGSFSGTRLKAVRVLRDVQDRVGGYILTVALINFCIGAIVAIGAWLLGMEAPVMWGGLAALLNFLPYVGPVAMIAALGLFSMGSGAGVAEGLIPPLAYFGLHLVEANVITPSILGARFTLNPVLILVSISYFSWIWGVPGALLSVPILITFAALFEHVGTPNIVGFLFGEPLFPHLEETVASEI